MFNPEAEAECAPGMWIRLWGWDSTEDGSRTASETRLQHLFSFLPGLALLIFEGSQGFLQDSVLGSPPQSLGRSLGTSTMISTTSRISSELCRVCHLPWDPGLCKPLRLRTDPHHQVWWVWWCARDPSRQTPQSGWVCVLPSQPPLVPLIERPEKQRATGKELGLPCSEH